MQMMPRIALLFNNLSITSTMQKLFKNEIMAQVPIAILSCLRCNFPGYILWIEFANMSVSMAFLGPYSYLIGSKCVASALISADATHLTKRNSG
jgi:hypothetical protein